jgi:hypothetical protein
MSFSELGSTSRFLFLATRTLSPIRSRTALTSPEVLQSSVSIMRTRMPTQYMALVPKIIASTADLGIPVLLCVLPLNIRMRIFPRAKGNGIVHRTGFKWRNV